MFPRDHRLSSVTERKNKVVLTPNLCCVVPHTKDFNPVIVSQVTANGYSEINRFKF